MPLPGSGSSRWGVILAAAEAGPRYKAGRIRHPRQEGACARAPGRREVRGPAAATPATDTFPLKCDRWLADGETLVPGLVALELHGSKTPDELAFLVEDTTLLTGDLLRGQVGGRLNLLPDAKLKDAARARASVRGLLARTRIDAVLVGDGWPVFRGGYAALEELVAALPHDT